jgi:hypothetical protein
MLLLSAGSLVWNEKLISVVSHGNIAWTLLGLAVLSTATFVFQWIQWRRNTTAAILRYRAVASMGELGQSPVSSIVLSFADIARLANPRVREELIYLLSTRILDMPPHIGSEYFRDLLQRLDIPDPIRDQLLSWTTSFLSLDSFNRRLVADQLRRTALPS